MVGLLLFFSCNFLCNWTKLINITFYKNWESITTPNKILKKIWPLLKAWTILSLGKMWPTCWPVLRPTCQSPCPAQGPAWVPPISQSFLKCTPVSVSFRIPESQQWLRKHYHFIAQAVFNVLAVLKLCLEENRSPLRRVTTHPQPRPWTSAQCSAHLRCSVSRRHT